jgi:hypothetical protein
MTTTTNLHNLVDEYDAKIKAMREELSNEFKKQFKVISTEIFAAHPEIIKFGWTQYTPYFNDGDACVFRYNSMHVCVDPDTADDSIYDWEEMWGDTAKKYPELKKFEDVLSKSEDILLAMFGDHVQVTVTPKGIDTEEFEHD